MPAASLASTAREILGAGLEQLELRLDALLLEQRRVDIDQHLAALVVLEQHGDLLGTGLLDQIVDHQIAEAPRARIPVPGAHQEVVVGRCQ